MDGSSWLALGAFFVVNFAAASSGAIFKPGDWYEALRKPGWTPPNWAFPVVWSSLFCLNAVAGWLVWETAGAAAAPALAVYGISLVLNFIWSVLFFGAHRMEWALAEVALLWGSIFWVIRLFAPIDLTAAWLVVPYFAWVGVAACLNLSLVRLNTARRVLA